MKRKRKIRHLCTAIAVILALMFPSAPVCAAENGVNAAREGTVAIVFAIKNAAWYYTWDGSSFQKGKSLGNIEFSSGSGFFIGNSGEDPKYLVTNEHVIDEYINAGEGGEVLIPYDMQVDTDGQPYVRCIHGSDCELRVYFSKNDYEYATVAQEGDRNKIDLAVLELLDGPTSKRRPLAIMNPTEDMVGEKVFTIGYPGNADNTLSSASQYGVNDSTVHSGSITRFVKDAKKGVERIAIDATIQHGNSGGPLITEDGYVIGINANVISTSPYENQIEADYYAISATELTHFLDQNSIPYETAGAQSIGGQDESGEAEESGAAADEGALAADENAPAADENAPAAQESVPAPQESAPAAPESAPAAQENAPAAPESVPAASSSVVTPDSNAQAENDDSTKDDSSMVIILIAAGAVVLAVIVVAVILVKRSGKKAAPAPAPSTPQDNGRTVAVSGGMGRTVAVSSVRGPVARSVLPQHNGLRVPIGSSPIMVGRDRAQCAIAYEEGTPGVSARHCTIAFDLSSQSFTVTDIGSSYGTFLMNGQRLQPNVPCSLKIGESFYVGDRANVIRLEVS